MISVVQHLRLARPTILSRLADFGTLIAILGNVSTTSSSSSSLSRPSGGSGSGNGRRLISSMASRTFSSSRPYATVLRSETTGAPTGMDMGANPSSRSSSGASSNSNSNSLQGTTVLMSPPPKEALDLGVELVEDSEARFQISERAAEQLRAISLKESNPNVALRVSVESGGCHGYQYKIDLTNLSEGAGDYHFARPTIAPSNVLIDPTSLSLLNGATLDFATELIGSTFRVTDNPHAVGGCGCGVSWEAKI